MDRIQKLRERTYDDTRFLGDIEFFTLFHKEYEKQIALPKWERYGAAFYAAFSGFTPVIGDGELIVGSRDFSVPPEAKQLWDEKYNKLTTEMAVMCGQDSHMAIDYDLLLSQGLYGIIRRIDGYLETCDEDKKPFYTCCKTCLLAIIQYAKNYAAFALAQSKGCNDPARKAELAKIAQICEKVPAHPAESFYEAVQAVHFITHCITLNPYRIWSQQFQLGHPDRYLWPYYEKDIQEGTITREFAQLLLDCLGIQINMRVPNGLSSGYLVGGRDPQGKIVANELTEMLMQVIEDVHLVYPAVGLCCAEGMPEKYLEQACKLLLKGHSHPAIFNDDLIAKGLKSYGVEDKYARNYIHSTCVEITPVAASNVWVASPYTNLAQLLLDMMDREYDSYEALLSRYYQALDASILENYQDQIRNRHTRKQFAINPLLSCFVDDCLARGLDIEEGGAIYNWIMPSFVGMANLVDGLYAIKELVFEKKQLTIGQFKSILDANYQDHAALRQQILNTLPKYGNDVDEIDLFFTEITQHIVDVCKNLSPMGVFSNGDLIPSVFCWIMHEHFGTETAATPDGRPAGFPLGDGSGPCQGRERNGPTASVLSSTKWDHSPFIGGVAVNLKFSKMSLGTGAPETLMAILKVFLQRGGFETQINVVDNETLKKAQQDPESYRDLVVRIGGYSDYFVKLSPQMQAEVILRTAHEI